MKYTRTICITFSSVLLGACVPPNVDIEAEQASLRATSDAYHEAAETNDMDSFVGFYTNDGVMFPPNAADEVGLQSVRNFATAFTQLPGFSMSFETVRVGVAASGDMGYTLSDGVVRFEGPDGTPVEDKIRDFHLWKKQNGEWKLAIDIWNSELPLPGAAAAATPLEGAWVVESWTDADGNTNDDPQPALYIFTPTHYSIMIAQGDEPRAGYEGDDMSDAEKLGAFDTLIANTGRYEIDGNVLKTRAYVAKDPNYMGGWPENEATYEFELDGDSLTIKSLTFAIGFTSTLRQGGDSKPLVG
jgi:ketosteroid isomerase-like protein